MEVIKRDNKCKENDDGKWWKGREEIETRISYDIHVHAKLWNGISFC